MIQVERGLKPRTLFLVSILVSYAMLGVLAFQASASSTYLEDARTGARTSQMIGSEFPFLAEEDPAQFDLENVSRSEFIPGEVLVKIRKTVVPRVVNGHWSAGIQSIDELLQRFKVTRITSVYRRALISSNAFKLEMPKDLDVLYVASLFEAIKLEIEYAEPNGFMHPLLVPNDANYAQQWAHQVIASEEAWNRTTGESNVIIAVVDSGVDYTHPDLVANIWNNTDEIPGNSIDDDSNGFVDDIRGWDFVEAAMQVYSGEDGTQPDNNPMDFLGHGTMLAGIAAAAANNSIGIAGVTWHCKIMPVRSGYAVAGGGSLEYDEVAAGIRYAADNGADIINLSFGGPYRTALVRDAVAYAQSKGCVLIAAAGNDGVRNQIYPGAYPGVVAVTATDQADAAAYFTNFGDWVEIAAPGVDILSTVSHNASLGPYKLTYPYDDASGTSVATAFVSGLAALILSEFPYMTRDQVKVQLLRTTVDLPPEGFDAYFGYGRIDAAQAVEQAPSNYDLLVLDWKLPFVSGSGETETKALYPSTYKLLGLTQNVSGSVANVQSNDGVYMAFRSYATATASQPLYAHLETTTIGGTTYYLQKLQSSDSAGTDLSVSLNPAGRKLWGQFVYQLTGVSSIPSSTLTVFYRTWFSSDGGAAHADVSILIRKSDGSIRTTIATNVANSPALTTTQQTLSGTYSFTEYTVVDQTDYLEIDYYCDVTTKKTGASAYLRIDNSALPIADQTRANVQLPSEFSTEVELIGSSNQEAWAQLAWTIDSSFTTQSVTTTFQLFNYTANAYPTSGNGYITDTLGTSDVTKTQTITTNPTHFRNATGHWKIKIKGVKSATSLFEWKADLVKCDVSWPVFRVSTTVLNFGTQAVTGINVRLFVNGTQKDSKQILALLSGWSAKVTCSWLPPSVGIYNVTTYVEPNNELSNATGNNAQSAYTWVKSDKAVKIPEDFQTIKEAIDKSNLDVYSGKAAITVSSGTYYESDLLIQNTLSSLTLSGDSSAPSIIGDGGLVCVWGNADNVTVQGFKIQNSYAAIELQGDNCVARSNNLTGNNYGIYDKSYFNNTIRNNTISGNSGRGISIVVSSGHTVVNNTVANNQYGISLGSVNKTLVSNNKVLSNYYGIWLTTSNDNTITNNTLSQNTYGFGVTGGIIQDFINTIDTTNMVEGKPVYYLINQSDLVIEPASFPSVGYLGIVNSTRITIRNLSISKSIQGIMLAYTTNSNITNVSVTYNHYGMSLTKSNSTLIVNNTASNDNLGIYTWTSINNTISYNTLSNDNNDGIYLSTSSTGNFVKNNAVTNTARGITLYYSNNNTLESNTVKRINKEGLYIASSSRNIISDNIVSNCSLTGSYGGMFLTNAPNNTIQGNRIAYNYQGIRTISSSSNTIYHNNFISNTQQVYSATSTNTWDKAAEGNYWSTYNGQDQNGDGIGDTPYTINTNNKDNYPLMKTWAKAYALNLRVIDWDMTDAIQGAYVYVNSESKASNAQGWANWTTIARGFVLLKAKWHSGWINGTFSLLVDCNRTVSIRSKVFDIVATTETEQGATLQNVNVTVYNATSGLIRTGITDSAGKAYLNNVPNSTLVFKCYDANSLQIANASRTITTENQAETVICNQNYVSASQEWNIITENGVFSLSFAPLPAFSISWYLRMNSRCLKERVRKIRSKQSRKRERKEVKTKNEWLT